MSDNMLNGWVAQHKSGRVYINSFNTTAPEFSMSQLMQHIFNIRSDDSSWDALIDASYWELDRKLIEDGWRIRPVKLVFLDPVKLVFLDEEPAK